MENNPLRAKLEEYVSKQLRDQFPSVRIISLKPFETAFGMEAILY